MKKILILLLVGVFVGSMVFVGIGCKVDEAVEEVAEEAAPAEEEAAEEPVVAEEVTTVAEDAKPGEGLVIYFQMGGLPGEPGAAPAARGAELAAEVWGVEIVLQAAAWDVTKLMTQFSEAIAAVPDGIVVPGLMGEAAARPLIEECMEQGTVVTTYQYNLPGLMAEFRDRGSAFFGMDMYEAGVAHARATIDGAGLEAGDRILLYDHLGPDPRGDLSQGVIDTAEENGILIDWVVNPAEEILSVDHATTSIAGYLAAHPDTKAIIVWHGIFAAEAETILRGCGFDDPDEIWMTGNDLTATLGALESGWLDCVGDDLLSMQGYHTVQQIVLTKLYGLPGFGIPITPTHYTWETVQPIVSFIEENLR